MAVTPELARIYASAPVDDRVIETLQVTHPQFSGNHYLTRELGGIAATLETGIEAFFSYVPFEIKLPDNGKSGFQDLTVAISNINRTFTDELELANEDPTVPVTFIYRAYSSLDLTQPGAILPEMSAAEITVDESLVSTNATIVDLVNRAFPFQIYTNILFPMLSNI